MALTVVKGLDSPTLPHGAVVTLGNYDGVHQGHRRIIRHLLEKAGKLNCPGLLITFDPHPLAVVSPEHAPLLLTTPAQKWTLLAEVGIGTVLVIPFDEEMARMEAERFCSEILCRRLGVRGVVVGEGFRFGKGREGSAGMLKHQAGSCNFFFESVKQVKVDDIIVSSTAIRKAVSEGKAARAQRLLGRPYALEGRVVRGERRGGGMGIPTVNMEPENELYPRAGVYISAIKADDEDRYHPSVTNIGFRPTFGGTELSIETHILDYDRDLYSRRISVRFYGFLREEMEFSSHDDFKASVHADILAARAFFEHLSGRP